MLGELNAAQIEQLLANQVVGRIGYHLDGRTYVVPVTYAYRDGFIWGHTSEGLKVQMMRKNPRVCFEVDQMDDMANWRSVIVQGRFEELKGEDARHAMGVLMERLMPLITSASSTPTHGMDPGSHRADTAGKTAVAYRIVVDEKTGRFEKR